MLAGQLPFQGSPSELMHEHQHAPLPLEQLKGLPQPVVVLLEVLLEKDPAQRFQNPAQLLQAFPRVTEAIDSERRLTANELRSGVGESAAQRGRLAGPSKPGAARAAKRHLFRWLVGLLVGGAGLLAGVFLFFGHGSFFLNQRSAEVLPTEKSIAVLPFENISANKDDAYFADGVQDEILNSLAKIAQLKVISRTSVMQYRGDNKRDLRQIAVALGVATVLEGTVRRDGNHVRVSTELIDARNDTTIWADSYDRDLTDIFVIQSEVAQSIAGKLSATLSLAEKKAIETKPTDNLEAYDLYLRGKERLVRTELSFGEAPDQKLLIEAADFFEKAVRLDPKFTLAYCAGAKAYDLIYWSYDPSPEVLTKADQAVNTAMRLQPDLPEVHLANAHHLYRGYLDYDGARAQLAIASLGLPNSAEADHYQALIDRRQGKFEQAIEKLSEAITRDPRNPIYLYTLADSFCDLRQFRAADKAFDRVIELRPDQPMLKIEKALYSFWENGDDSAVWSVIRALPLSVAGTTDVLSWRLQFALVDRDWDQAAQLIEKLKEENIDFANGSRPVPVECYSVLLSRLRGEQPNAAAGFSALREQLNLRAQKSAQDAGLLSQLAVVDALLNNQEDAISEAKRAAEILPVSKDALGGPGILMNLAVVYAWTNELDLAFMTLNPLTRMPNGIYYGQLREPFWEPLRKDPRFGKLLAELAPRD